MAYPAHIGGFAGGRGRSGSSSGSSSTSRAGRAACPLRRTDESRCGPRGRRPVRPRQRLVADRSRGHRPRRRLLRAAHAGGPPGRRGRGRRALDLRDRPVRPAAANADQQLRRRLRHPLPRRGRHPARERDPCRGPRPPTRTARRTPPTTPRRCCGCTPRSSTPRCASTTASSAPLSAADEQRDTTREAAQVACGSACCRPILPPDDPRASGWMAGMIAAAASASRPPRARSRRTVLYPAALVPRIAWDAAHLVSLATLPDAIRRQYGLGWSPAASAASSAWLPSRGARCRLFRAPLRHVPQARTAERRVRLAERHVRRLRASVGLAAIMGSARSASARPQRPRGKRR